MKLTEKTLTELVALHNELTPAKPIKKFRDKPTAIKRVEALLALDTAGQAPPSELSPVGQQELENAVEAATKPRQRSYTFNAAPGEVTWPQEGCKRYRLAEHMLSLGDKGATFAQLHRWTEKQGFGWKRNDLADAIRLLIRKNRFGATTSCNGSISIYQPNS